MIPRAPVLIVEDNADIREALTLSLMSDGYAVEGAANGRDALDSLRGGLRPCVILLDYHMPDMNGRAFRSAQLAENLQATVPVILYSADSSVDPGELGLSAMIRKPTGVDQILPVVKHWATFSARRKR